MKNCTLLIGVVENGECNWCTKPLVGRRRRWCSDPCSRAYSDNHSYSMARKLAKRRDRYRCVTCGSKEKLEVNHIKPCIGRHNKFGCWHHLSNLETLCHKCHLKVTATQRASGAFARRKTKRRRK